MKKQYIVPAIYGHKLRVESQILANSTPRSLNRVDIGNLKKNGVTTPSSASDFIPDFSQPRDLGGGEGIKWIDGTDDNAISNI